MWKREMFCQKTINLWIGKSPALFVDDWSSRLADIDSYTCLWTIPRLRSETIHRHLALCYLYIYIFYSYHNSRHMLSYIVEDYLSLRWLQLLRVLVCRLINFW